MEVRVRYPLGSKPGSIQEVVFALLPFLAAGILPLATNNRMPDWLVGIAGLVLILGCGALLLVGLAAGWPRWSLPYAGFLLAVALVPLALMFFPGGMSFGLVWLGAIAALIVLIVFAIRRLDFKRVRRDPALLSFLVYGAFLVLLAFSFEGYQFEYWAQTPAALALALGAWGYLRGASPGRRIAALAVGALAAILIVGLGQAWLEQSGLIDSWRQAHGWQTALLETLAVWGLVLTPMLLPAIPALRSGSSQPG